jgi:fido (protein-threonine AMPylation protein)
MTDLFQEPGGATPLDPGQRDGLLQTWVTNRGDLNEAEQENIVKGAVWARRRRGAKAIDLLHDDYVKILHKQMFGEVWSRHVPTEQNQYRY